MFIFTLPPIKWVPVFEWRTRVERRIDPDFSSAVGDNQTRWDNRFRIGADFTSGKTVSGQLRYQYSHSTFWRPTLNNSDDNSDLFLGNISLKMKEGTWTVGRQIVSKGNRRLIDVSEYSQRNKVYDVVRFKGGRWDAFAGKVAMTSNIRDYSKLSMASYEGPIGETMVVFKSDSKTDQNHWTLDQRYEFKKDKFSGQVEAALQSGKSGGRKLSSWFSNARVNYAAAPNTTVFVEANVASGGITNGDQHLFDPLYGTGHAPYGLMDLQGLRNMRQLEIGVSQKLSKTLTGLVSFNGYGLYDPEDGWYGTGGSINRRPGGTLRDATGKSGRDVGSELNFALTWLPNKRDTLSLEIGVFKPGNFVKSLIGPATANQVWGLLTYGFKF